MLVTGAQGVLLRIDRSVNARRGREGVYSLLRRCVRHLDIVQICSVERKVGGIGKRLVRRGQFTFQSLALVVSVVARLVNIVQYCLEGLIDFLGRYRMTKWGENWSVL